MKLKALFSIRRMVLFGLNMCHFVRQYLAISKGVCVMPLSYKLLSLFAKKLEQSTFTSISRGNSFVIGRNRWQSLGAWYGLYIKWMYKKIPTLPLELLASYHRYVGPGLSSCMEWISCFKQAASDRLLSTVHISIKNSTMRSHTEKRSYPFNLSFSPFAPARRDTITIIVV